MTVVLGPCPCSVCRRLLWWNGWAWVEKKPTETEPISPHHRCKQAKAA